MHGYYSADAVKDLLAVKEGEIDFLKSKIRTLETQNLYLETYCAELEEKIDIIRGPFERE